MLNKVVKITGTNSVFSQLLGRYGVIKEYAYEDKWLVEFNVATETTGSLSHTVREIDFEVVGKLTNKTDKEHKDTSEENFKRLSEVLKMRLKEFLSSQV